MNKEERRVGEREDCANAGHQTKWEPENTVKCQNYYRFILYVLPWGAPHIDRFWTQEGMGGESCFNRCTTIRQKRSKKMTERCRSGEREEKTARSAGSYLDRVQWAEGWEEVGGPCMCLTLMPDCNGWAALFTCRMFLQGTGAAWEKSSGDGVGQLSLSRWCVQVALTLQVQVPTKNGVFGKQQNSGAAGTIKKSLTELWQLFDQPRLQTSWATSWWFSQQNKFYGFDSSHPFSTATSVQLLFDCHSLPHRRQLVENAAWRHQLRDSGCQTHMMANRAWSCGLLLWLEAGLN